MDLIRGTRARDIGRITARLRADGGFALPTVMLMMLAVFALVSVGVVATVDVQRGTVRDESTKSALQLAETGVNQALLHFNRIKASDTNACSPSGSTASNGWCQGPTTTDAGGGTYSYQVQVCAYATNGSCPTPAPASGTPPYSIEVVATGTQGDASRRVDVKAHSASGNPMFGDYQVKAGDGITLDSNSRIHAGTATNGDLVLNSNAKQCGQASVGPGHEMRTAGDNSYFTDPNCTSPATTVNNQQIDLPPVNPGDVSTVNDDGRLFSQDLISGNRANACWNTKKGDGTNGSCGARHLDIGSNTTVTLGGSKYMFCKLTMSSNSSLLVASGIPGTPHTVAIYFDSPENCGYSSGTAQVDMASNTRISSNDGSPVQLLFVGSTGTPFRQTIINMSSNTDINAACEQNFVIYAPLSDINLNSNSTYCGGLAGKSLHLDSNADVRTNGLSQQFTVPNTPAHYQIDRFIECTAVTGTSPPSIGC